MFPKNSAFNPDPPPETLRVRELFRNTEASIRREEGNQSADVSYSELERWYHSLDELVRRFDVPREHVVSGQHVATASEELERLRDEVYRHLR